MDDRSRTWAEVSMGALENNYRLIKHRLPHSCQILGLVKANAYGHGAVPVARKLQQLGAGYLAVATPEEALELRRAQINSPILVLGVTPENMAQELADNDITLSVNDLRSAQLYSRAVSGRKIKIHIKVDTGMSRLGVFCAGRLEEAAREVQDILRLPNLCSEGIFTHFSTSDEPQDSGNTKEQYGLFCSIIDRVRKTSGHTFSLRHCANSGALINHPDTMMDMCRPGIALYGYPPNEFEGLRPVMTLKTRIVQLKEISAGAAVSYGRTFSACKKTKIAVLPIGYGDGLHRCLSGKFDLTIASQRAPQVGRICMDMCMADVTEIENVQLGDEITVFGQDAFETAQTLADFAGTISYEIVCSLSARVPRIYV